MLPIVTWKACSYVNVVQCVMFSEVSTCGVFHLWCVLLVRCFMKTRSILHTSLCTACVLLSWCDMHLMASWHTFLVFCSTWQRLASTGVWWRPFSLSCMYMMRTMCTCHLISRRKSPSCSSKGRFFPTLTGHHRSCHAGLLSWCMWWYPDILQWVPFNQRVDWRLLILDIDSRAGPSAEACCCSHLTVMSSFSAACGTG